MRSEEYGAALIENMDLIHLNEMRYLLQLINIIKDLGTRHRAGIGMSENSDAVVVIVSSSPSTISSSAANTFAGNSDMTMIRARTSESVFLIVRLTVVPPVELK